MTPFVAVPYGLEHPKDRPPTYAEVYCRYCLDADGLSYRDGFFVCRFCRIRPFYARLRFRNRVLPANPEGIEDLDHLQINLA